MPQADRDAATPPADDAFALYDLTIFLTSYDTGSNFTIANGTKGGGLGGDVLAQDEGGSTVKHVDWVWPDCLAGDDGSSGNEDARGHYNVRKHKCLSLSPPY